MRKERKQYSAEEKVAVLRRRLLDKVPVSDLCEELVLRPTVFYRWQKVPWLVGSVSTRFGYKGNYSSWIRCFLAGLERRVRRSGYAI